MRRLLMLLAPGLLLVSCDKPGTSGARQGDEEAPATRAAARDRHAPREPSPGTPAALREILRAAAGMESPEEREKVLADVAWSALETDPELASEAFRQLAPGGTERLRLIQHHAMRLAEQDPDEALRWAAVAGTEQEIAAAQGQVALVLAETDPRRAADLLSETGIAGREFDVAVVQVIQRWAARSAPDAAVWVGMFPPGAARETGLKIIVSQWAQTAAPAALSWLTSLRDETVRKEALLAMEVALLQQPQDLRDSWLEHADENTRSDLERYREQAIEELGPDLSGPNGHTLAQP